MTPWARARARAKTLSLYTNQASRTEAVGLQGMRIGYLCVGKESEGGDNCQRLGKSE